VNEVLLIGNLSDMPKLVVTANGVSKCVFHLATQREYADQLTGQRVTDFHTIIAWRKLAEICEKYLHKGRQCAVKGSIQYRSYTGNDGVKRYMTEIVASKIKFLGSSQQENEEAALGEPTSPDGYMPVEPDESPF